MKYTLFILFLVLAACHKSQTLPDVASGLVVNIPFDGTTTEMVSGTPGNVYHAVFTPDHHGVHGRAMQFSASDSSTVDFGDLALASVDSSNQFTISCWVKVDDTVGNFAVLSKRGFSGPWEYCIDNFFSHNSFVLDNWCIDGSNSIYGTDPLRSGAGITPGQWQNLAYVADGNTLRVFVNGILQSGVDQRRITLSFSKTTAHFIVGNGGGYGRNFYFSGAVDEIRIYNRTLLQSEVQYLSTL